MNALLLHNRLVARRHTALLGAIVIAFAVRPVIGDGRVALIVFNLAVVILMLVALYTMHVGELVGERETLLAQRRRRSVLGWALAVPAIAERLVTVFLPSPRLFMIGSICWLLLCGFVTWSNLRNVLRHREVTSETISLSISVYR